MNKEELKSKGFIQIDEFTDEDTGFIETFWWNRKTGDMILLDQNGNLVLEGNLYEEKI